MKKRFTPKQIRDMRLMRKEGATYEVIADKYKTSKSTVHSIVKKQYYYYIPDDADVPLEECYKRLRSESTSEEATVLIDLFWEKIGKSKSQ